MMRATRVIARARLAHYAGTNARVEAVAVAAHSTCTLAHQRDRSRWMHLARTLLTNDTAADATPAVPAAAESAPHSAKRARGPAYATIPSSMADDASDIVNEFEFEDAPASRSQSASFLIPERQPQQPPQRPASGLHTALSDAVAPDALVRHYAVHTPCHPSSIFSLPVLNQLRGLLHTLAFKKMVIRASVNPRSWDIDPEWDFDPKLEIPTNWQHPNWSRQQKLIGAAPNPAMLATAPQMEDENAAVSAMQKDPFTRTQIEQNLADFIVSPMLHQDTELLATIREAQSEYFATADRLAAKHPQSSPDVKLHRADEKRIKQTMHKSWLANDHATYRSVVDLFVRFMEAPVDDPVDVSGLTAAMAKPVHPSASRELLKSRSGRLRFDPSLVGLSNLSAPHEWYPLARSIPRKFIIHTYHAMQRLMQARSGVYAGPLRLLAWEVYDKMCKQGVPCNLKTGQEVEQVEGACHTSSTVEMMSTDTIYDVAVIDEVQMISATDRAWAWTRAVLGVAAYEVHLCGDPSMVGLIEELASITGEEVEVREYERLTPLHVEPPLARGIKDIRKGDCIVAFSQKMLYRLRHEIEHQLGLKCCIIYGSLPPETRRDQTKKFNDPDSGYDVLVSTDAIGMGLNLNIRRVIFARMDKFDGVINRPLSISETLQIAGRAGRFNTNQPAPGTILTKEQAAASNAGFVTTLTPDDHEYLQWALVQQLQPIERAGLAPTPEQLQTLQDLRPNETLSNLVTYFAQYAQLDQTYFNVDMDGFKAIADLIEKIPFPSQSMRFDFCKAPVRVDHMSVRGAVLQFAKLLAGGEIVSLRSYKVPAIRLPKDQLGFTAMEDLYAITQLYVWLGHKFGEHIFVDLWKAVEIGHKTSAIIQAGLERMSPPETFLASRRRLTQRLASRPPQPTDNGRSHSSPSASDKPRSAAYTGPRKDRPRPPPKHQRTDGFKQQPVR